METQGLPMGAELEGCEHGVQRCAGAEGGGGFGLVGLVVAADVHGVALDGEEFADDFFFVGGELGCDGCAYLAPTVLGNLL